MKKNLGINIFLLVLLEFAFMALPVASTKGATYHQSHDLFDKKDNEKIAIEKWDAQSLREVNDAKTLSEILIALNFTRKESAARDLGMIRWDYLFGNALLESRSSDETQSVLHRERTKDERWNTIIIARELLGNWTSTKMVVCLYGTPAQKKQWDEESLKEVEGAKTLQEIRRAFARAREGSRAQRLAVIKASKFLPSK